VGLEPREPVVFVPELVWEPPAPGPPPPEPATPEPVFVPFPVAPPLVPYSPAPVVPDLLADALVDGLPLVPSAVGFFDEPSPVAPEARPVSPLVVPLSVPRVLLAVLPEPPLRWLSAPLLVPEGLSPVPRLSLHPTMTAAASTPANNAFMAFSFPVAQSSPPDSRKQIVRRLHANERDNPTAQAETRSSSSSEAPGAQSAQKMHRDL